MVAKTEEFDFPARYEPIRRLGRGSSGEVWAARDRISGRLLALKLLREGAPAAEVLSLVREATVLSGVEGLGVPRVLHFGRLPKSRRHYMVRELVNGTSLSALLEKGARMSFALSAVAQAADLLTRLHRALMLHGDVKPANIIVGDDGAATLVDLGLAAPWMEGGAKPEGLTPRYAAPELFLGAPLTPRAEVFALGATLREVLERAKPTAAAVSASVLQVVERATKQQAEARYPSADEFAEALRRAAKLRRGDRFEGARVWSIGGIDQFCSELLDQVRALPLGGGVLLSGSTGSGRSTVLRRVAWSLGASGEEVALIGASEGSNLKEALDVVLETERTQPLVLLVDDAEKRSTDDLARLDALRRDGAKLVMAITAETAACDLPGDTFTLCQMRPLSTEFAAVLVQRMIPSLSEALVQHIVERTGGLPGVIRAVVDKLEGEAVVSVDDIDRRLDEVPLPPGAVVPPQEIHRVLNRGRFDKAAELLKAYSTDESVVIAIARAKLATGRGDPETALKVLARVEDALDPSGDADGVAAWNVQKARALLRSGEYGDAERNANLALTRLGSAMLGELTGDGLDGEPGSQRQLGTLAADALSVCGLAQSLSARHDDAARTLQRSVDVARSSGDARMLAVSLGSLAFARQRNDHLDEAERAHAEALSFAEKAGDAGLVATTRLNLAGIAKTRGDIARAITHLEAAVDMGRRSGRGSTLRQALLNLANLDLYVGRLARARHAIDQVAAERDRLAQAQQAQLLALEAEHAGLVGELDVAEQKCLACAQAYEELGRSIDAAEALLERVLLLAHGSEAPELDELREQLARGEELLGRSGAHRALLLVARADVARLANDSEAALTCFGEAIQAARDSGQQQWEWRSLAARAQIHNAAGQMSNAAADRKAALKVLEEVAAELPRDLREVYWSDSRRRALRSAPRTSIRPLMVTGHDPMGDPDASTQIGTTMRGDRLWRVLEVTREIAGEHNVDKLLELVTDDAIALVRAERGFVLMRSRSREDELSVHAARDRDGTDPHARFSRSIAERVVQTGEPFVAVDAGQDDRVADYVSVHQLMLRSVACVPIRSRGTRAIGALYVETRMLPGQSFDQELPTLSAFADQVAIAIETARLINENRQRTIELEEANVELEAARAKLEQSLGRRTEQLANTRRDLRSARAVLRGHFGYKGIVGTSVAMRRLYAIIDRVKDTDVAVLITGESGTGKEIIARAIHDAGPRSKGKMVGVNCGAIPEHLLESELFGHVRGAFTGADRDRKGLFRELDEGTILLDEIGEMPPKMQAGLLRVLQEKVVRPVGGSQEVKVNTRVIAATHRNLDKMVADGSFREDLYYRLNVIELRVPALRERADDIPSLIDHFLRLFAVRYKRERRTVSREALKDLMAYRWPGYVRQLENVLLNAWILSDAAELAPMDFEFPQSVPVAVDDESHTRPQSLAARREVEKDKILEALTATNWNRAKAAELMEMPRRTFYRRLKKFGIQ